MFFLSDLEVFSIYIEVVYQQLLLLFKQSGLGKIEKLFHRAIKLVITQG